MSDRKRHRTFDTSSDGRDQKRRREDGEVEGRLESLIARVGERSTASLKKKFGRAS